MEDKVDHDGSVCEDGLRNKRSARKRRPARKASAGRETTSRNTVTAPGHHTKTSNPDSSEDENLDGHYGLNIRVKEEVSSGEEEAYGKAEGHVSYREVDTSGKGGEHVSARDSDTSGKGREHVSARDSDTSGKGGEHVSSRDSDTSGKGGEHVSARDSDTSGKGGEHVSARDSDTSGKGGEHVSSRDSDTSGKGEEHVSSREDDTTPGDKDLGNTKTVLVQNSPVTRHKPKRRTSKFAIVRSKEISEDLRKQVVEAHMSGKGYKKIAKNLEMNLSTVKGIISKWRKFSTVATLPRSGRPTKISAQARNTILKHMRDNTRVTAKDLKASLALANINVHESTIRKTLNKWCSRDFTMEEEEPAVQQE